MENGGKDDTRKKFDFDKEEEEHDDSANCYQSINDLLKEHKLKSETTFGSKGSSPKYKRPRYESDFYTTPKKDHL
ncbi:unnamed protein product [Linum trigynum]|uniref:Uncharacterized protein n=1 Tax=Linum trigynum TaxID=586398 RepID=A0AAV2CGI3_9ROSI